jgi:molybdenum cofactor cytidylyltransferase
MTDETAGVVGIVLAAGSSTRLGQPKQLLPLGGTTVLSWVVATAEQSPLDRVIVVLGGAGESVAESLCPRRAELVVNSAFATGCASSLRAGLDAAGACSAVALLLGDMPGVSCDVLSSVLSQWASGPPSWAAVTSYRGQLGHPFLFSAAAFATLRALHGDKAVWKLVDQAPVTTIRRFPVDDELPRDIDTWDDYRAVCASLGLTASGRFPDPVGG